MSAAQFSLTHHSPFTIIIHHSSFIIRHSFATHYSSLITHHSSLIIHHSSFIIHHSSFIIHHSPLIRHSLLITHHSSLITHHSSFIIHHSSFINHHSSFATHSPLITHHSSLITHHSSFIIHHSSFIIHHSSFIIHHCPFMRRLLFLLFLCSFANAQTIEIPPATDSGRTIQALIEKASMDELRWPDFSDYRKHLHNFYAPNGYALAWSRDGQPPPQALTVIDLLQAADAKGIHAVDYDGPRWPARLKSLKESNAARFDVALTVALMRYT